MKVAVVGCGYVGLVSGVGLASLGHEVIGIDADGDRLASIARGRAPFHEPGLDEALAEAQSARRFRTSGSLADAGSADVVLICVQTPPLTAGGVELRFVRDAAAALGRMPAATEARRVVAVRSTVPPGTTEDVVAPLLVRAGSVAAASNPEFLREGSALSDFLHTDRVVVGVHEAWAAEMLGELYAPLGAPIIVTSPATAELGKYASNALLATLVSFSNEMARVAELTPGVDVEDVLGIVHRDRRLTVATGAGPVPAGIVSYLKAGCGYGGSCLTKDLGALLAYGRAQAEALPLLSAVETVNREQAGRLVERTERVLGGLSGRRIAVLGAAFKAGTDDLRDSPALRIVAELAARGAHVAVYDPLVEPARLGQALAETVEIADSLQSALTGAAACIVTTHDPAFRAVENPDARAGMLVVDGRRALAPDRFDGQPYLAIGRAQGAETP